ncbi:sensor histidine kinase [Nonomuraea soli]|uniref:histidine kinase n=1 Tax=Nonomuraea soli TaxID=1032476 RepID=A0A7W0CCN2_9ACTN|nr:histidine kinase [Nonomuraea soli]MBA2888705.1 signal transduction histidine kinase [Nonomuraea soli]
MSWLQRSAYALALLALVCAAGGCVFAAISPTAGDLAYLAVALVIGAASCGLGLVIARRLPANAVGLLMVWLGCGVVVLTVRDLYWNTLAREPGALPPMGEVATAVLKEAGIWPICAAALLLLLFPDGRLPSPRWRWAAISLVSVAAVAQVAGIFNPVAPPRENEPLTLPFGTWPEGVLMVLDGLTLFGLMALLIASAASMFVKYGRAGRIGRTRLKWLALAGICLPLYLIGCFAEYLIFGEPLWFSVAAGVALLAGIPLATAVAMLKHDLYDIDKAIAATVTYGALTAVVVAIYALTSFAGGLVAADGSAVAAAAATAVCAVVLAPAHRRLRRGVDRRFYPLRGAVLGAVEDLLRRTHAGRAAPEQVEQTLRQALRDPDLRVGYVLPGRDDLVSSGGDAIEGGRTVPVTMGGSRIGALLPGDDGLASPELLRESASAAAVLVELVRLRVELAGALREVEASRTRLLQVGYRERRRLERDLHDGVQQRLVSLGMTLRLAQRSARAVPVDELIDQSVAELGTAVAELRQIAHGLRPSSLDDGLDQALLALAGTVPLPVEVDVAARELPDDVATTAYFVASEAVTNALKHASASRIALRVGQHDGQVRLEIRDDGRGGARIGGSSGLADRVAAHGGSLTVRSPAGYGTVVEAVLPCAS